MSLLQVILNIMMPSDAKIHGVNLIDINHYSEYVMKEGLKTLLMNWFNTEK